VNAGLDLVHFTFQRAFHTDLPSIYQPHDLQHEHLPEFFSRSELKRRRRDYREFSDAADLVVVGTSWVRDDVVARLHQAPEKVRVVPLAPVELPDPDGGSLPASLPETGFLLYPAAAWPHKNHPVLMEALSHLRGQGLVVPAVLPGAAGGRSHLLRASIDRLELADQVWLPGFVSDAALSHLYGQARLVCVPSLFESASYPIWEAFRHGVPVVAAAVTSLPDQVGDAGLLFDAHDPVALADCIERVWRDEALRRQLVDRGRHRVAGISRETMTARYIALYLEVLGRPLTASDRRVLEAPVFL
jgi:glycosyltransferase involved in cell wall biosynthesis